jgi:hypothetical protein
MPETNSMTKFVYDDTKLVTVGTQVNALSTISTFSDKRTTAAMQ